MSFGIPEKSMRMIITVLKQKKEVERASIFGSRSMGNYKKGSDIDIALHGRYITPEIVNEIEVELNEKLPLPYYFDIVHYESIDHGGFKQHIDEYGTTFYNR